MDANLPSPINYIALCYKDGAGKFPCRQTFWASSSRRKIILRSVMDIGNGLSLANVVELETLAAA